MEEETSWWKIIAGWVTFFVLLYLYPSQVLTLLCLGFILGFIGLIIWSEIAHSSMTRNATVTGWIVGGVMFLFLMAVRPDAARAVSDGDVCADGWASPSIGTQGACSHHGGVSHGGGSGVGGLYIMAVFLGSIYVGHSVATKLNK